MKAFDTLNFPSDRVVRMICSEYQITTEEFESSFRYDTLPEARQLYCLALQRLGAKNKQICTLTGYSPARVTLTIQSAERLFKEIPYFKERLQGIISYINRL